MNESTLAVSNHWTTKLPILLGWLALILVLGLAYDWQLYMMVGVWWQNADYGHGFFVPIFALMLLLIRSEMITGEPKPEQWWGQLLKSRTAWAGTGLGAVAGALLFVTHTTQTVNVEWWTCLFSAGAFGGTLLGLTFLVGELFLAQRDSGKPLPADWSWWAMAFFGLWLLMRFASAWRSQLSTDWYSILPFLAGLVIFVGGWRALQWAWPSVVFLFFMIPLPSRIASGLRDPLQTIGTKVSVFIIQTLGIRATAEGNVISLSGGKLGVEEACSGLRMLMLFAAVCVAVALVIRRPLWERIVIVVSAFPIAIFANVARITVTAILYEAARWWPNLIDTEMADHLFHDWAGYFMMPVAMLVLWVELAVLNRVFIETKSKGPLAIGGSLAGSMVAAGRRPSGSRSEPS